MKFAALLILGLALAGCSKDHTILTCDACFERDGQMFCGQTVVDQFRMKTPVTEDDAKLTAGREACREFAARKGGGYNGPPFKKAFDECGNTITMKDLRRTHCDETIVHLPWDPKKDGGL